MRIDPEHDKYIAAGYLFFCAIVIVALIWMFWEDI